MLHRVKRDQDVHQGKYNGLGGKFHPGETPEECVVREVLEESGLKIRNPKLRGFLTFPDFKKHQDWYVYVYTAEKFDGELIESDEGILEWVETAQLARLPLWEGDPIFFKWLESDKFFSGKFVYRDKKLIHHEVTFY